MYNELEDFDYLPEDVPGKHLVTNKEIRTIIDSLEKSSEKKFKDLDDEDIYKVVKWATSVRAGEMMLDFVLKGFMDIEWDEESNDVICNATKYAKDCVEKYDKEHEVPEDDIDNIIKEKKNKILKIYKMNDIIEWWVDYSLEEAKNNFISEWMDYQYESFLKDTENAREVTSNELEELQYVDEDDEDKVISYGDKLKELKEPQMFAVSTDYEDRL